MVLLLDNLLLAAAIVAAIPCGVVAIECLAAAFPQRRQTRFPAHPASVAIVVPAHDEAGLIGKTVAALEPQLRSSDRLLVVADNCSDRTADEARAAGAEVVERTDPTRRGKGYALEHALSVLQSDPPRGVVIVDADCFIARGSILDLAALAVAEQRPIQADYLIEPPAEATPMSTVSGFALLVINRIRPMGLRRLGLPCQLMGTGMAFPWNLIRGAKPTGDNLVEDLAMGVDLAARGHPPRYCRDIEVVSTLPSQDHAGLRQRRRWEHGRLQTITVALPRLLSAAFRHRRIDLLAMALDVSVPPLALLATMCFGMLATAVLAGLTGGSWSPALVLAMAGVLATLGLSSAWWRHAKDLFPPRVLWSIPGYVLRKIPLYLAFVGRRQTDWERTQRENRKPE